MMGLKIKKKIKGYFWRWPADPLPNINAWFSLKSRLFLATIISFLRISKDNCAPNSLAILMNLLFLGYLFRENLLGDTLD